MRFVGEGAGSVAADTAPGGAAPQGGEIGIDFLSLGMGVHMIRKFASAVVFALACAFAVPAHSQGVLGVMVVDSQTNPPGAFINTVQPGSPAAVAGLVPGDVITGVDGKPISGADALVQIMAAHRPGDRLELQVAHYQSVASDVAVTLGGAGATAAPAAQPAPQAAAAGGGQAKPDITWTRFTDPVEHAFTVDVPAGWRVAGGTRRMNSVEIRAGVEAISPDGAIDLFYSDPDVPLFTVPSPMLEMAGLRQGMVYNPGQGVQLLIEPYMTGEQFAANWGPRRVAESCSNVSRTGAQARPDQSQAINTTYQQYGITTSIQAGEATFACTLNGTPAVGYVFAATEFVQNQASALWDVKSLAGFIARREAAASAAGLLTHMVASFRIDPSWQAQQNNLTQQFNQIVAETNHVVSNAIIENGRKLAATSDAIFAAGQARSNATTNAIDHYDAYGVRGTSDYVNPATGSTYGNLDNSYAHTYVNNNQEIRQTDSETPPGPGWTEIKVAP